ncbi:hyaluronan mediated motility receptor-like [Teleopsis dalmanni]|uniref:hyaluronan mediated motility receptor-like n=1 Tax=Teleopsis dalmanni TaxID=139649 RepID=UPI0018CD68FA|nr:hyaluronan mediated motility receptor-like [Teleopsis dalmanni]
MNVTSSSNEMNTSSNKNFQLERALSAILDEQETISQETEESSLVIKQLETKKIDIENEIAQLKGEIGELGTAIRAQTCTVDERNNLLEKLEQCKHVLKTKDREMNELENYNHQQQVLHIGAKAQLTKKIESINSQIRELSYSQIGSDIESYEIPVNPDSEDLKNAIPILKTIREQLRQKSDENEKALKQYEDKILQISNEIDEVLLPKSRSISHTLTTAQKTLASVEEQTENMRKAYESKADILLANIKELDDFILTYEKIVIEKKEEVQQLKEQNEKFMSEVEEKYHALADAREDYLTKYDQTLNVAKEKLVEVRTVVDETDQVLANLKLNTN